MRCRKKNAYKNGKMRRVSCDTNGQIDIKNMRIRRGKDNGGREGRIR